MSYLFATASLRMEGWSISYVYEVGPYYRGTRHPVTVTIRDSRDYIRVLLYSYYTTITGGGVLLIHTIGVQKNTTIKVLEYVDMAIVRGTSTRLRNFIGIFQAPTL